MTALNPAKGFNDFDEEKDVYQVGGFPEVNALLVHRFSALPPNIIGATLEFRVRSIAGATGISDGISILFDDGTSAGDLTELWWRFFGEFAVPPYPYEEGLLQPFDVWNFPDDETFVIDLAMLPKAPALGGGFVNVIPKLNQYGFMDVVLGDESSTDYLILRLTVACTGGVPATQTVRLGSPANPAALLGGQTSGPVIGATWDPLIAHTTFMPSAILDFVAVTALPANVHVPPMGTLLCDLGVSPLIVFSTVPGLPFSIAIPPSCDLVGASLCSQGASTDGSSLALTNALDITIGSF
jgi:hypothetical protein